MSNMLVVTTKSQPGNGGQLGVYNNAYDLFRQHYDGEESMILVIDIKKFGILHQFKPKQIMAGEKYIADDYFTFLIKTIDDETADKIRANNPDWLRDKPREDALREIRQRVHLRILEQFRFDIMDKSAGYKIITERGF